MADLPAAVDKHQMLAQSGVNRRPIIQAKAQHHIQGKLCHVT